jgi:hypothetical protein
MPVDRQADCVRFALSRDEGSKIAFQYVYERKHEPVSHGIVEYDVVAGAWIILLTDELAQRHAECYLAAYLERRPRERAVTLRG